MTSKTGTVAQAQLLWKLLVKNNNTKGFPEAVIMSKVLKTPMTEVGKWIDYENSLTGFNRQSSPATMAQITYIRDLRLKAGMRNGTDAPNIKNTTFEEADLMIKDLKEDIAYYAEIKALSSAEIVSVEVLTSEEV
jgi:hypothetical protein